MIIITIFKFLLKTIVGLIIFALIIGRVFYAKATEALVIDPARSVPVFGSVIGAAWDGAGQIGPTITRKTVEIADQVETSELQIDETVLGVTQSENPKDEITQAIEKQVETKTQQLKNMPSYLIEQVKEEVRQELYTQICQNWANNPSEQTQEQNATDIQNTTDSKTP